MKIKVSALLFCLLTLNLFGKINAQLVRKPSVGAHIFLKDFVTPNNLSNHPIGHIFSDKLIANTSQMNWGFGLQYMEGITKTIDFSAAVNAASFDYPYYSGERVGKDALLLEFVAKAMFKARTDNKRWIPYLSAGLGTSLHNGENFGIFFPSSCGVQVKLKKNIFAFADLGYNLRLSSFTNNHFQYTVGLIHPLSKAKKEKEAVVVVKPAPEKDTDGDGIVDSKDKCPTVKGSLKYEGCPIPDTDKDGINDEEDKCPTVAGVKKYEGCPVPDTDGDGINDDDDKCPTIAGLGRYLGCPAPDTDGDGINDDDDKCPTEKGTKANNGCPELKDFNFEAKNVEFNTGSDVLTTKAMQELDKCATILIQHPTLNIEIEGHTDNVGDANKNLVLSQKRADKVKAYLVSKGVAANRLTAVGFGANKPIADNKTTDGKTQNRRVEFKVKK